MTTISSPSPSRARAAAAADLAASRVTVYFCAVGPVADDNLVGSIGPPPPLAALVPAAAALALLAVPPPAEALPVKNAWPVGAMNLPPRPPRPRPPLPPPRPPLPRPPPLPFGLRLRELIFAGLDAVDVVVERGLASFDDVVAAAVLVEADGSAAVAFFVGRLSGLNLPAWTGFFFGGMF